jgi:hypothetical protein
MQNKQECLLASLPERLDITRRPVFLPWDCNRKDGSKHLPETGVHSDLLTRLEGGEELSVAFV